MDQRENHSTEENSTINDGSICGYDSLHHLLSANLKPHLFKEVSRLLLGLNCGKALEPLPLPDSVEALSSQHDFDLQVEASSIEKFGIRESLNN